MIKLLSRLLGKKEEKVNQSSFIAMSSSDGLDDTYMFDFKNWASDYRGSGGGSFISIGGVVNGSTEEDTSKTPKKIAIKPIQVLEELEKIPTPWNLMGLDDKIEVLKHKEKLIVQIYAKREVTALIERLENRKKYNEFKEFFEQFQNTTDEAIEKLLEKYDLVMRSSDLFVPEFPDDAIKVMKDYTEKLDELCGKKPVFYVIAEPDKFRKAYEKRDPILLVQSPFGFYWQILGAWDKEMLLLHEL
jgi:hypothetical protein